MRGVNLIPPHRLRHARRAGLVRAWVVGGAAYTALLTAVYLGAVLVVGGQASADGQRLQRIVQQTDRIRREHQGLLPELTEMQKKVQAAQAVSAQPDWSILLQALAEALGEAAVLQEVELLPLEGKTVAAQSVADGTAEGTAGVVPASRYLLRLRGLGQTQGVVAEFVLALERLEVFEAVRLVQTAKQVYQETEAVSFSVECVLGGGTAP